ncbi:MAG: rRNA cytosine-C5-methylase [Propionibacterium sp.]|nr:MAG: rRNA cytosine-C5-methylase [Propionibacterium sp.]
MVCLRLGAHQILAMNVPTHAAVHETVQLGKRRIGARVAGLLNAILRKVAKRDLPGWLDTLSANMTHSKREAFINHHPSWIADSYRRALPEAQVTQALIANNQPPVTTLVVRPGIGDLSELTDAGCTPVRHSPYGAYYKGNPAQLDAVSCGRAAVQDEGSQLAALLLTHPEAPSGPWLDLCSGPGGKSALLAGLAPDGLVAAELAVHRARLVAQNLTGFPHAQTVVADGRHPAWPEASFARVLADVPCTGLGALRRRPEARWRKSQADLVGLTDLQRQLLNTAIWSAKPGGVIAYVTCSPHPDETHAVVDWALKAHSVSRPRQSRRRGGADP